MNPRLRAFFASPIARALAALALIVVLGCIFHQNGAFFRWTTHQQVLREVSVDGILACGMTLVIVTAGVDLSVGSVLALAAVAFATLSLVRGQPALVAVPAVLALGATIGAANGALVSVARIQPFVVTLAAMVFARGLAKRIAAGKKVTSYVVDASGVGHSSPLPPIFDLLDTRVFGGSVSIVTLVFLACVALTWLILARTRLGRQLYAVGGSLEAARLSGVPTRRVVTLAYALSGFFAAIAGICQAAQETQGDPETGVGYELDAIAMVVIGGTPLRGGKGGVGLTLIGALTIGYLQKVLSLNAFALETRLMLTGAIILGAVLFQRGRAA
ncbi:MAG: ABC transporter permease [Myxococcales bacterium]|nr:ABC transporter permease [Myxococcales bacterium]